jgi:hypothetical protein
MKTDPREAKLPVWAKNLLEEGRKKAALAWPSIEEPEPIAIANGDSHSWVKGRLQNTSAWEFNVHNRTVERRWFDGLYVYRTGDLKNGSRPDGRYYATEKDAAVAMWWEVARGAATAIYRAKLRAAEAE